MHWGSWPPITSLTWEKRSKHSYLGHQRTKIIPEALGVHEIVQESALCGEKQANKCWRTEISKGLPKQERSANQTSKSSKKFPLQEGRTEYICC